MAPDLFRLKLFIALLCVLGAFLSAYIIQRLYFYYKTRRMADIDTAYIHPYPEGLIALGAAFLLCATISGIDTLSSLQSYVALQPDSTLMEFDVDIVKQGEIRLRVYDASGDDTQFAEAKAVHFFSGDSFRLTVDEVAFGPHLSLLGQPKHLRLINISGVRFEKGNEHSQKTVTLQLNEPRDLPLFSWLFENGGTSKKLQAPVTLKNGDIIKLYCGHDGEVSLIRETRSQ